jgi:hypothetical protein
MAMLQELAVHCATGSAVCAAAQWRCLGQAQTAGQGTCAGECVAEQKQASAVLLVHSNELLAWRVMLMLHWADSR